MTTGRQDTEDDVLSFLSQAHTCDSDDAKRSVLGQLASILKIEVPNQTDILNMRQAIWRALNTKFMMIDAVADRVPSWLSAK